MKVDGKPYRTIWLGTDGTTVQVIDQTLLPHRFVVRDLSTMEDAEHAIRTMIVERDRVSYQVGGGIVADSHPETEYDETVAKGRGLRAVLESFASG